MPNTVSPARVETLSVSASPGSRLDERALSLARGLQPVSHSAKKDLLPARLKILGAFLKDVYRHFDESSRAETTVSHAAEWILDNFYIIEQALRQTAENIPPDFYQRLPLARVDGGEMTRIHILAFTLTKATDSHLEADSIKSFVDAFQSITPLKIGEIWALAPMLRLSILETLTDSLAHITHLNLPPASIPDPSTGSGQRLEPAAPDPRPDHPPVSDETIVINSIISLRMLATQDWLSFFENTCMVEDALRGDPADVYTRMDFDTRNRYRNVVEEIALGAQADEFTIARTAIHLAESGERLRTRHVGYYLTGPGRVILESQLEYRPPRGSRLRRWLTRHSAPAYLGSIILITALLTFAAAGYAAVVGGSALQVILTFLLMFFPASAIASDLTNWLVVQIVPPRILPRLNFQEGIPPECSTMVVIPSLLANESELASLLRQLENHHLGNADPNVRFALLSDLVDAPQQEMHGEAQLLEQARAGIEDLNACYANEGYQPFYLFHRDRNWNPAEGCWMGWERKRGKLSAFNGLLLGKEDNSFSIQLGDLSVLPAIRYVVTLDADTTLPRDSVRRLVGTIAHPLNQAEFDPASGTLIDGYTVLQPRVQVRPTAANRSIFSRIYSGDTTLDLYTRAVSDVYQDLFGEGSYVGKGIYDVSAFERSLHGRVPENTLLSHDLFEGLHGRCGLVTNVVLFEDYPLHYVSYAHRFHRWIRGDWQLLPWLKSQVPHDTQGKIRSDLSMLDRWKIADNLRRSLVTPAILALIIGGWLFLPGSSLVWVTLALSTYVVAVLFGFFATLRARRTDQYPETTARPVQQAALRDLFQIAFLPHETSITLDAILTTLVRLTVTRKRLLQWVTAAHTVNVFGRELKIRSAWRAMGLAPAVSVLLFLLVIVLNPPVVWLATPFLLVWAVSPYLAFWISKPITFATEKLSPPQEDQLRQLARTTWLYFEKFVGPDDHWLPPDHFQEEPRGLVAHRTSPTNIGLLLLSTLSAYDLGYIGPQELVLRIRNTLDGMDRLEKQRGHFLNWYDTRTLSPLSPRYISTVDNGNLSACLLTLRQGCDDVVSRPIIHWQGLMDTLDVLETALHQAHIEGTKSELHDVISRLREQAERLQDARQCSPQFLQSLFRESRAELEDLLAKVVEAAAEQLDYETIRTLSTWIERTRHHLSQIQREIETLCPWSLAMAQIPPLFSRPDLQPELANAWKELVASLSLKPALEEIPAICTNTLDALQGVRAHLLGDERDSLSWCDAFAAQLETARASAAELLGDLQLIRARAEAHFEAMNFHFLYDPQRKVFHIGYNVDSGRLDTSYYDLLASEARLTSLVAIAKGEVPQNHWLYLARPITQLNGARVLLSWSGTMFEYLMPSLLTRRYLGTLLDQSCLAAVKYQISYGQTNHIPWGISESSFYYFDANQTYQYRAFGVPGLGYKRGLAEDLVVAPYASILALPYAPAAVLQNMERFRKYNLFGLYGLYESVDFTAERMGTGQEYAVVRSYMAHHQGMILLSLCNTLSEDSMIRRFHADPRMQTVALLLQEQVPVRAPIEHPHPHEIGVVHPVHPVVPFDPWQAKLNSPYPQLHYLSNGNYSLLITAAGSGYSRWRDMDLTRWHADTTLDHFGSWIYVQDLEKERLWSATFQPTAALPTSQQVNFHPHTVEFLRRDDDISTHLRIAIAPDADVEVRRVTLTNHGESARGMVLTNYAEVILAPQMADHRHPAYNKLFIECEHITEGNILLYHRRPRSAQDKPVYLAYFIVNERDDLQMTGYETDRARFLGRGNTPRTPASLQQLSNATATLDPIAALQTQVTVKEYASLQVAFVTVAAASRREVLALAHDFRQWHRINRVLDDARTQAEEELIQVGLSSPQLEQIQKLLSALLYPAPALRSDPVTLAGNTLGQSGLWAFSISGDYPILLINLKQEKDLDLLSELIRAHTYWHRRGLKIDLVILNQRETSYDQHFHGKIYHLLSRTNSDDRLGKRGGIFVLREDQMSVAERILIATAARVTLEGEAGPLATQLEKLDRLPVRLPRFVPTQSPLSEPSSIPLLGSRPGLVFDNGLGGFSPDGREYIIHLARGQWTPAPWINVIANPEFGFLVSEAGLGCTWAGNSGENRLTPWHNDPVSDPPSEAIYLRDEDTGELWSPTPLPTRADAPYTIRHGTGYTIFEHRSHEVEQRLRLFAVPDAPVKIVQLKLQNTSARTRRINITYYAEWVLGTTHEEMAQYIVPEYASERFAMLARNPYNRDFSERVAFLAATRELQGLTTDRTEFLGSLGSYAHPAALERVGLTALAQAGADPCAAMQLLLWLAPGETKEVTFLLGQGADHAEALKLITQYQNMTNVEAAWDVLQSFWDDKLKDIQVETPDAAMDILLNRWLPYQTLSCRIWGRTAFYQSGGAYGFRDQLQDVLAFLYTRPAIAREHILRAARHQFEQGDVLHWWHVARPADRGVRTRISDDLLWLPYTVAQYVHITGDRAILEERVPFLAAEPLKVGEHDRYGDFPYGETESLYEHCRRALAKGTTAGPHGLPLMGEGDWNDGMNNVGTGGTGESIWLGWFLHATLADFARLCDGDGSAEQAASYRQQAETLRLALETFAWDGSWYRRAFYDDGKPLGSAENRDCQIDSISQSWAVISGAAEHGRARAAMQSLYERLVRREDGLILLLAPPFDRTIRDPGYIKGYQPGIRENGGQYTHAAIWAIWAFAKLGDGDRVFELYQLINPIQHADTPQKVARYQVEPYVVAADIYSAPAHLGRGGWTWYSGSSGWMYRLGIEIILGIKKAGQALEFDPCIPRHWPGYKVNYRFGSTQYRIDVQNPRHVNCGIQQILLDEQIVVNNRVPLVDDGHPHEVRIVMG
ncbi:MAG: hypothetical protein HYZ25_16450 [Chloroflexi bacterium]|nr:hypothetical protein [Chloroflexota bacterium]